MERPLITFILLAYNQETMIGDAVRGAFSQDYSPLEIILSDDASTDGTFRVMEEMAADYAGPHKVILNRNPSNLGIIAHENRLAEMAGGELIVVAAGDDFSFPNRVTETFNLWKENGRKPDMLHFNFEPFGKHPLTYRVNPETDTLSFQIRHGGSRAFGATAAWTKRLHRFFGPVNTTGFWEDKTISFRAVLLGGIACKDIPVVKYRHDRPPLLLKGRDLIRSNDEQLQRRMSFYHSFIIDIETLLSKAPHRRLECDKLTLEIRKRMSAIERERLLFSMRRIDQIIGLFHLWVGRLWNKRSFRKRASLTRLILRHGLLTGRTRGNN